jgi:PAS domain-containing protein
MDAKSKLYHDKNDDTDGASTSEYIPERDDVDDDAHSYVPQIQFKRDDAVIDSIESTLEALESEICEDLFDAVWNSFPVPWAVCSAKGILLKCNSAFAKYFHCPAGGPVGSSIESLIVGEDAAPLIRLVKLSIKKLVVAVL